MSTTTETPAVGVTLSLTERQLACGVCGIAVDGPHRRVNVAELDIDAIVDPRHPAGVADLPHPKAVAVTRCASCGERRQRASSIVAEHPRITARIGSPEIVVDRLEHVLIAFAVVGAEEPLRTDADISRAMTHLGAPGAAARWERRLAPVLSARGATHIAQAAPFAHVGEELRATVREGMAATLRARIALPDADKPIPGDSARRGCLFCGVGTAREWHQLTASTRALGGAPAPEPLDGDVCPACADAMNGVGAVGRSAMLRALFAHLGMPPRNVDDLVEVRLFGFGALPEGTPANAKPWGHIDTSALRRDLATEGIR